MSLQAYESMMETLHLLKSPANASHLEKIDQAVWTEAAWSDYVYWQTQDKKTLKRINLLVSELRRHPETGIGKPEQLRGSLSGYWFRRIDDTHRLV